jgi:hypothetical protein
MPTDSPEVGVSHPDRAVHRSYAQGMTNSTSGRSTAGPAIRYPQLADQQWLRHAYLDQHLSLLQIAAHIGCTQASVRMALVRYEIPIRAAYRSAVLDGLPVDRAIDLVREHGLRGAATALGVDYVTFTAHLNKLRILGRARELAHERIERLRAEKAHWPAQLHDRDWLHDRYQRASARAIAETLHVSPDTVFEALDRHGIPRRPERQRAPLAHLRRAPAQPGELVCLFPECVAAANARGMCGGHLRRWQRGQLPDGIEPLPSGYQRRLTLGTTDRGDCAHEGCRRTPRHRGYCDGHRDEAPPGYNRDPLHSANAERNQQAAAETVHAARVRLTTATDPERRAVLTARIEHPDATLAELAVLLGVSKDAYAARLRRALADIREQGRQAS